MIILDQVVCLFVHLCVLFDRYTKLFHPSALSNIKNWRKTPMLLGAFILKLRAGAAPWLPGSCLDRWQARDASLAAVSRARSVGPSRFPLSRAPCSLPEDRPETSNYTRALISARIASPRPQVTSGDTSRPRPSSRFCFFMLQLTRRRFIR